MIDELYVPHFESGNCAYVYSDSIIRVYDTQPRYNSTIHYYEYMYNSHYIGREGETTFSNYSTLPTCHDNVTTNFYRRTDITDILIITTLFLGWTWFLISKLVKTLLKGGRIW